MSRPYAEVVSALLQTIERTQDAALGRAARAIFQSLKDDGVLHVFGSGHSHAVAEEAYHRAGGLVPVNAIQETFLTPLTPPALSGQLERLPGLARLILDTHDVRPGEVLLVISNSGINAVPIEMAVEGKSRGLTIVALTSVTHSRAVPSRDAGGRRLLDVADVVLDTCGEPGDAAVAYPNLGVRVAATSLLAGAYLINSLLCRVVELYLAEGRTPPVYLSANIPGGDTHNRALEAKYRERVRGL